MPIKARPNINSYGLRANDVKTALIPIPEMIDHHHQRPRIFVRQPGGYRRAGPEEDKSQRTVADDLLIAQTKITPCIISRLGKDKHDKMIEKMANIDKHIMHSFVFQCLLICHASALIAKTRSLPKSVAGQAVKCKLIYVLREEQITGP